MSASDPTPPPAERWLRWACAFVWLATGLLVLHPDYREIGEGYLGELGLPAWLMWITCAFEVGLAARLLWRPMGRPLAALQLAMMATFTVILAVDEPLLLASPFGMLTKNVPMATAIVACALLERGRFTPAVERVLLAGLACIWLTEGLFPKILFQQAEEIAVVEGTGLVPFDVPSFLVGMGVAQIAAALGLLLLRGRPRAWLLLLQLAALVALPLLVGAQDPALFTHPFGPLTKNVPILAGTLVVLLRTTPFLSADWSLLTLVTFAVPPERLAAHVPPGVTLDVRDGQAFVSFVTLEMSRVSVLGVPLPGLRFGDVNLRFYVHRGERAGVVFLRELVPSRLVAWVARTLFGEPFGVAAIDTRVERGSATMSVTRTIDGAHRVRLDARPERELPPSDSDEAFFVERYWGFGHDRRGGAVEYRVAHPAWEVHPVVGHALDVRFAALYGEAWGVLDDLEPVSVALAAGSVSHVYAAV